jgi:hypothetical protein
MDFFFVKYREYLKLHDYLEILNITNNLSNIDEIIIDKLIYELICISDIKHKFEKLLKKSIILCLKLNKSNKLDELLIKTKNSINSLNYYGSDKYYKHCIDHNLVECFKVLYKNDFKVDDNIFRKICLFGNIKLIKFANENNFRYEHYHSLFHDDYEADYDNPYKNNKYILTYNCASNGHIKGLKYLHSNGHRISKEVLMISLKKFHIKCINYCLKNGLSLDENIVLNSCDTLDSISYCEAKGFSYVFSDINYIKRLIKYDKFECLIYILEKYQIKINNEILKEVLFNKFNQNSKIKILDILFNYEILFDKSLFINAILNNNFYYAKYIIKNFKFKLTNKEYNKIINTFDLNLVMLIDNNQDKSDLNLELELKGLNQSYTNENQTKKIVEFLDYIIANHNIVLKIYYTFLNDENLFIFQKYDKYIIYDESMIDSCLRINSIKLLNHLLNKKFLNVVIKYSLLRFNKNVDDELLYKILQKLEPLPKNFNLDNFRYEFSILIKNNNLKSFEYLLKTILISLPKNKKNSNIKKQCMNNLYLTSLLNKNIKSINIISQFVKFNKSLFESLVNYIEYEYQNYYDYDDDYDETYHYHNNYFEFENNFSLNFYENCENNIINIILEYKDILNYLVQRYDLQIFNKYKHLLNN